MSTTLSYHRTLELVVVECYTCSVEYGIPASMQKMLLEKRKAASVYCPNGHQWHYTGQSAEERIREAQAQFVHEQDQRIAAERQVIAYKGHLTRTRKRVANGVCPCCNRTFVNVARHMAGQHPDYAEATP